MKSTQTYLAAKFRALHESGCFVLPNPWDIGTAIYLERLGFKALATTSAGFAFSRSKPDGGVPRDEMLAHIGEIVEATALPVNADFHAGYADEPEDVAANVRLCVETGVAGQKIECAVCLDVLCCPEESAPGGQRKTRADRNAAHTDVGESGQCKLMIKTRDEDIHGFWRQCFYNPRDLIWIADTRRIETIGAGFSIRGEPVECGVQRIGITDQPGFATAG